MFQPSETQSSNNNDGFQREAQLGRRFISNTPAFVSRILKLYSKSDQMEGEGAEKDRAGKSCWHPRLRAHKA
jgi:hypothetical protein